MILILFLIYVLFFLNFLFQFIEKLIEFNIKKHFMDVCETKYVLLFHTEIFSSFKQIIYFRVVQMRFFFSRHVKNISYLLEK